MKITLIQPMMQMRPMDTKLKTRMAPSLGLFTVAQCVREGNEIEIINENVDERIDYDSPDRHCGDYRHGRHTAACYRNSKRISKAGSSGGGRWDSDHLLS